MAIRSLTLLLGLCLLGLLLAIGAEALEVPSHNCESYFSYYRRGNGEYYGLFTAPRAGINSFSWEVVFNAHGTSQSHTVSSLKPYPSKDEAFENIHNGERGQVFVDFQNFGNELPKLIRLELNDQLLCSNSEYDAPSSTMTRRQSMSTSTPIRQKAEPRPEPRPSSVSQSSSNPFLNKFWTQQRPQEGPQERPQPEITPHVRESNYGECGQEGFAATLIGGDLVTRGQYPWMAALYEGSATATYKCVVSVISKRTVITAAHCIYGKSASQLWVYLGRHDRNQNPEEHADLVGVSEVRTAPQYNGNPLPDSDVGLLVLRQAMEYTRYIQPLCLWSSGMRVPANEGDRGSVSGWGYDETGEKTRFPKAANVRLVTRDECRKMKRAQDFITSRTVCAGNSEAHGPCFGDSGAALIVLRNNRWVLRGVVSISPSQGGKCDLSLFVIYCDISQHLDWIGQNMVS